MVFSRSNPLGWAFGEILTSAQMNQLDINMTRALDGYAGGTYSPSALLKLNNEFEVDTTLASGTNIDAIKGTGKGTGSGIEGYGGSTGKGGKFEGGASGGEAGDFTAVNANADTIIARAAGSATTLAVVLKIDATSGTNSATGQRITTEGGIASWLESATNYVQRLECTNATTPTKPLIRYDAFSAKPSSLSTPTDDGGFWVKSDGSLRFYYGGTTYDLVLDGGNTRSKAIRAWGQITTDGVGGISLNNSYGCTVALNSGNVRVTFITSMTSANYSVCATSFSAGSGTAADRIASVLNMTSTYCDIQLYEVSLTSILNLSSTAASLMFQIYGDVAAY